MLLTERYEIGLKLTSVHYTLFSTMCHTFVMDIAHLLLQLIFIRNVLFWVDLPCFSSDVRFSVSYLASV